MENLTVWEHPENYCGFSPDGDYVIYTRHRDSVILDNSNYKRILEDLESAMESYDGPDSEEDSPRDNGWVYDWRANHWAVGWVEYIMVRADAPQSVIEEASEIVAALEDYPVYDESDYSERELEAVCEYWASMDMRERIDMLQEYDGSIFAARAESPYTDRIPDGVLETIQIYVNE